MLVAAALALAQRVQWTDRLAHGLRQHRTALGFLAPAAIAMFVAAPVPIWMLSVPPPVAMFMISARSVAE